jgi:hypothetical protein
MHQHHHRMPSRGCLCRRIEMIKVHWKKKSCFQDRESSREIQEENEEPPNPLTPGEKRHALAASCCRAKVHPVLERQEGDRWNNGGFGRGRTTQLFERGRGQMSEEGFGTSPSSWTGELDSRRRSDRRKRRERERRERPTGLRLR